MERDFILECSCAPLRLLGKDLFQQVNVILMADVSVCNRDKEGASAFITITCKMLVPRAWFAPAMLLLRQLHTPSSPLIISMLNSTFPIDKLSVMYSSNGKNVGLEKKSVLHTKQWPPIRLLIYYTAGHCYATWQRRRTSSKAHGQCILPITSANTNQQARKMELQVNINSIHKS